MSESKKRRSTFPVGLIGTALFAAVLILIVWLAYREVHSAERKHAASHDGYERFIECLKEGRSAALCRAELEKSPYEQSGGYYDLKAQQEMAEWALVMLIVTSVGIGFVAMTLKAATDANEGFKVSAERQLRAYVAYNGFYVGFQLAGAEESVAGATLSVQWKNSGPTPAMRVRTWLTVESFEPGKTPQEKAFADMGDYISEGAPMGPDGVLSAYAHVTLDQLRDNWTGAKHLFVWGWIEYTSLDVNVRHRTEVCGRILFGADPTNAKTAMKGNPDIRFLTPFNAMDDDCVHKPKT